MRACIIFLLMMVYLQLGCQSKKSLIAPKNQLKSVQNIAPPNIIHGIGFAKLSELNPDRSFIEARKKAIIDLEASILTSVYLEFYGTELQSSLEAEFGISDTLFDSEIAMVDSTTIEDWAIYYVRHIENNISFPISVINDAIETNWTTELYEPRIINGFWISSGLHKKSRFNPNRGWFKAKQNALKNLSEYLNTNVQSLQRIQNNDFESVHYVTSKHVFNHIGVVARKVIDEIYHILLIIHEQDIVKIK